MSVLLSWVLTGGHIFWVVFTLCLVVTDGRRVLDLPVSQWVAGSSPAGGAIFFSRKSGTYERLQNSHAAHPDDILSFLPLNVDIDGR